MTKIEFLVFILHPKVGVMFGTSVKVHIIDEEEDYKDIGLHGFDYKLFCEEGGGGTK